MVMINTTLSDMNSLIGKELSIEDYQDIAFKYGLDLDIEGDLLSFEITSDRADIISKFSLAKLIKRIIGIKVKDKAIKFEKLNVSIENTERKFVNCLVLRLKDRVGSLMDDLITLQEKMNQVIGRDRKFAACGFFDLDKIAFPMTYKHIEREKVKFIPLGFGEPKDYDFIVNSTKQGQDYAHLIRNPIVWVDASGNIVALPPIINSDPYSMTEDTKNIFIDITGIDRSIVDQFTKILIVNLSEIGDVSVLKVNYASKEIDPGLSFNRKVLSLNENNIRSILGIEIGLGLAKKFLQMSGFSVRQSKDSLDVEIPYYRYDVIHQVDLVDEIMRMYGVDKIKPNESIKYLKSVHDKNYFTVEMIRDLMVGMGYQELDLNLLTSEKFQFENTGNKAEDYARIISSKSNLNTMIRKFIYPEGLRFLSNNLDKKFPQNLFDIGYVIERDDSSDTGFSGKLKFFGLRCSADENISDLTISLRIIIKQVFDKEIRIEQVDLPGFISGRSGRVLLDDKSIGFIGEVHPSTLNNFGVNMPVSLFEIYLD